ncbi:MAG: hypothetical protein ACFFDN_17160 [Candidatus Hodarchaeota archaeon]
MAQLPIPHIGKIEEFLRKLLGSDISEGRLNESIETFKKLALEEWINWINGIYRPSSLSQNSSDRIFNIYTEIKKDLPKIDELVNLFNIPVGRARYIISSLKWSAQPEYKELERNKLKSLLEEKIAGKADTDTIKPYVENILLDELKRIEVYFTYESENQDFEPITVLGGDKSHGLEFRMTVKSAKLIIERLDELVV